MQTFSFNTTPDAIHSLAKHIIESAKACIETKGSFNLVLTGGNSPKMLYNILADQYKNEINWEAVYFFIGDERHVPSNHKDYNGLMARENLLNPLNIKEENIFLVNTSLNPQEAAEDYYARIVKHFNQAIINFDFTLLGMGTDAHTASIFPGTSICKINTKESIEAVFVEKLNSWRISFNATLINQSKEIAFLVFGKDKLEAFTSVQSHPNQLEYPASLIQGNVFWYTNFN